MDQTCGPDFQSQATLVPSTDLGTEVQAECPRFEWGCI